MAAPLHHVCREAQTLRITFAEDQDGLHQTLCDLEAWETDFFDLNNTNNPESVARSLIASNEATPTSAREGIKLCPL
jgi:hypothetical protein